MMTLDQLRIFVAVAEALNFTTAARTLGRSQPAVSAAIAALEDACATRLFSRVARHVELTEAGALLLDHARDLLRRASEAEQAIDDLVGLKRGSLRLFASQTVASYWVAPLLSRFRARYPMIALSLDAGNTTQAAEALRAGAADIALVEAPVDDPAFARTSLPGDRLELVVAPTHPWARHDKIGLHVLTGTEWVLRERGSGTRQIFEDWLRAHKVNPAALQVTLELPSGEAVKQAVEAGGGATVISSLTVARELQSGRLRRVALTGPGGKGDPLPERHFHLIRHRERYRSRAEAAFIAMATETGDGKTI